ncbi:hypothetical protein JTB14_003536 [Gonioctena quinquepunctata]|nr:hypothetical protein JTB14_003536 [Gonioctena quinquepunctata]
MSLTNYTALPSTSPPYHTIYRITTGNSYQLSMTWRKCGITVLEKMTYKNTKMKKTKQNPEKPWLSEQLIRHIHQKRILSTKFERSGREEDFDKYRQYSNWLDLTIKQARLNYENSSIERYKTFYSYFRQHLSSKVSEPIIWSNGQMSSLNSKRADIPASHYESVYKEETGGPLPQSSNNMSNMEFNVDNVRKVQTISNVTHFHEVIL